MIRKRVKFENLEEELVDLQDILKNSLQKEVLEIRKIDKNHNFTLVCKDFAEISNFARVDNQAFRAIRAHSPGPYTFIFKGTKEVPKRVLNEKRKTIGIRIPDNKIALALL